MPIKIKGQAWEWRESGPWGPGRYLTKEAEEQILANPKEASEPPDWLMKPVARKVKSLNN